MITIQFLPYDEMEGLTSNQLINKLLKIVKHNRIVLLEGKLTSEEQAILIKKTMKSIDEEFPGVEISTIEPQMTGGSMNLRKRLLKLLMGKRHGLTIIGPAAQIAEIKKDPNKIELLMK
jgi:hypothetical protein